MRNLALIFALCISFVSCNKDIEELQSTKINLQEYLDGKVFIGRSTMGDCDYGIQYFPILKVVDSGFYYHEHALYHTDPSSFLYSEAFSKSFFRFEFLKETERGVFEGTHVGDSTTRYARIDTNNDLFTWYNTSDERDLKFDGVEGTMHDYRPSYEELEAFEGSYLGDDGKEYKLEASPQLKVAQKGDSGYFYWMFQIDYAHNLEWDEDGAIVYGTRCRGQLEKINLKGDTVFLDFYYNGKHTVLTLTRQ